MKAPKSSKGKEKAVVADADEGSQSADWVSFGSETNQIPVVYRPDGRLCFVASGSLVKIYDPVTAERLSVLPVPGASEDRTVTCMLLHPTNDTHLLVGSADGWVRAWDYLNGTVVRHVNVGPPVTAIAMDSKHLYVATHRTWARKQAAPASKTALKSKNGSILRFSWSSKSSEIRKLLELNLPVLAVQLSHDNKYLVAATQYQLYVALTDNFPAGWARFDPPDALTCLAVHPSEPLLATGDSRGMIKIYYPFDEMWWARRLALQETMGQKQTYKGEPAAQSLHWHAHPVGDISFTPGGYMVSGGEESVLVIWHLESNQKDFLPLRDAPISSLTPAPLESDTPNDIAIRLTDGTLRFVDRALMDVRRSVLAMKVSPSSQSGESYASPLTIQPGTGNLVLNSSHPSALQVYSISQDRNLAELEVAPSNRVANRRGGAPLEPTRIKKLALSDPLPDNSNWMATYQTWRGAGYAEDAALKFFKVSTQANEHDLVTEVALSPKDALLSMAFARNRDPRLLTTHADGSIRVWVYAISSQKKVPPAWRCQSRFVHRQESAPGCAWCPDGSLFAVAHPFSVSLWDAQSLTLLRVFTPHDIGTLQSVSFSGASGELLVAKGSVGVAGWDLISFEERVHVDTLPREILPDGDRLHILERKRLSTFSIDAKASAASLDLPHAATTACLFPGQDNSIAYITEKGDVVLARGSSGNDPVSILTLFPAQKKELSIFEEVFHSLSKDAAADVPAPNLAVTSNGLPTVFDQPSHLLPSMQLLWRDALALPVSVAQAAPPEEAPFASMDIDMEPEAPSTHPEGSKALPIRATREYDNVISTAFLSRWTS